MVIQAGLQRHCRRCIDLRCHRQQQRQAVTRASAAAASQPTIAPATATLMTRKAWHIVQQGDMDSLQLVEEPMPTLQPGQVLVEVQAWGLNFADVFCALGLYKAAPKGDFIPGLEFAGIVVETSPQDSRSSSSSSTTSLQQQQQQQPDIAPGARVLGVLRFGAFASHVAVPAAYLRPVPEDWSMEQAASYPVQTLTAAYGLFEAGALRPGQAVLVHSAAGGVGLQALQILSKCDAAVLGLVGSDSKAQLLQERFAKYAKQRQTIDSQQHMEVQQPETQHQQQQKQQQQQQQQRPYLEFAARQGDSAAVKQQLSGFLSRAGCSGFDVILDSLGPGPYFQPSYEALNPCGRHVIFGAGSLTPKPGLRVSLNPLDLLSAPKSLWGLLKLGWGWFWRPRLDVISMPGDNKGVLGFNLIYLYERLEVLAGLYERVEELDLEPPLVGRVFGFEQMPSALRYLQSGESVGKVVLSVDPDAISM